MKNYSTNGCEVKLTYCQFGSKPPYEKAKSAVEAGRFWSNYIAMANNATRNSEVWAGKKDELGVDIPGVIDENQLLFIQL
ncbi:MAG: hypothetical protein IKF52_01950 [Clostridia bacterium]|nr:hypothetical protein [Clostridia bacterium]